MQTDATMLAKNPNNSQQCSDLLRPFAWAFSGGGRGGGSRELPVDVKEKFSKIVVVYPQNPSPRGWRPANFRSV